MTKAVNGSTSTANMGLGQQGCKGSKGRLHKTAKISLIFAIRLILPGCLSNFCKHPTDEHYIAQNQMERQENSYLKIGQRAWQNWSDMTKIGSTTNCVNGA